MIYYEFFNILKLCLPPQRVSSGITEALKESGKITDGEQMKKQIKGKSSGNNLNIYRVGNKSVLLIISLSYEFKWKTYFTNFDLIRVL